jgi:hypothetical protein
MKLIFECWCWLAYFDYLMRFDNFDAVQARIRDQPTCKHDDGRVDASAISHAIDVACVLYFKRVLCLQRSAATTVMLRLYGWNAEMVIGAQLLPFQSHAWVEINHQVLNDKPYVPEIFQVLDRF